MATYITLCNFTDQGLKNIRETTKRAEAAQEAGRKAGVEMTGLYWTLGQYDLVVVLQAPDEKTAMAFALTIASAGNLRMQTMQAFTKEEMNGMLAKVG